MSNDDLLKLLRNMTDNSKTTTALIHDINEDQKACYINLTKLCEHMTEYLKLISVLEAEVKDLQERVNRLEGNPAHTAKTQKRIKKINEELKKD